LLEQAENLGYERQWDRLIAATLLERATLYISEGRITEASTCVARLDRLAQARCSSGLCAWSDIENYRALGAACLAAAREDSQTAIEILSKLLKMAEGIHRTYFALRIRVALARALLGANESVKALESFRQGLKIAAPAGFFQTLLDQGAAVGPLLHGARECMERSAHATEQLQYLDRLLQGWHSLYQSDPGQWPGEIKEPLSSRERGILELIAAGRSNKEIARALGIGPETVKSHVKSIFLKLSVDKRAQAVARAQSLGLVPTL